ncbi:hypothetical protein E2C01_099734 [Portunus trituberculatus]|uniref:Uncharacterized protein n=1 Tax=Portunus trituberculatus TaxID=210409 RepID=A0A5B7KHL1_PORTR|nr:hypothetical protein [Portunus trituberculatus]
MMPALFTATTRGSGAPSTVRMR